MRPHFFNYESNDETNDNGLVLEDMLTYDNLLEELESDREFTIKILSCSRVEGQVDEEGFNQEQPFPNSFS